MSAPHPLLLKVAQTLGKDASGVLRVEAAAVAELRQKGQALERGEELYVLLGSIVTFAAFLRNAKGSPAAAAVLSQVALDLAPRLEDLVRRRPESVSKDGIANLKKSLARQRASMENAGPVPPKKKEKA